MIKSKMRQEWKLFMTQAGTEKYEILWNDEGSLMEVCNENKGKNKKEKHWKMIHTAYVALLIYPGLYIFSFTDW